MDDASVIKTRVDNVIAEFKVLGLQNISKIEKVHQDQAKHFAKGCIGDVPEDIDFKLLGSAFLVKFVAWPLVIFAVIFIDKN